MKGLAHENYFAHPTLLVSHNKGARLMNPFSETDDLRHKMEREKAQHREALIDKSSHDIAKMTTDENQALIYELQVHQIELIMQNEELINTQQSLRKSQNDFERIYNLAPIAYLTLSQHGLIQQANKEATALLNQPLTSLLSQRFEKFIHIDDQDAYYLFFRSLQKEQSSAHLITRITVPNHASPSHEPHCHGLDFYQCSPNECPHNRAMTYLELTGVIDNRENDEPTIYLALKNVTSYKVLEDTLACLNNKQADRIKVQQTDLMIHRQLLRATTAELQQSYQTSSELKNTSTHIFNASSEGIVMLNLLGAIESTNTAACLLLGYDEAELLGIAFNQLLMSPLFTESSVSLLLQDNQDPNSPSYRVEGRHSNGTIVPLSLSLVIFTLNQINHFAVVIRDNSLRLRQEQHEKEHLAEIAHMTRLSLIGSMGSGIAHQVNQPLTAICNYSQACIQLIKAEQPNLTKLSEVLTKTYEQAQKAGKIIHRMKDLASQRTTSRSMTSINALIENASNFYAYECYQYNINVILTLNPNIPNIAIDSVQIEQVLLNLIKNAMDALKEQLSESDKTISIQTQLNNGLEVRIKDNGPGLTDLQKEKILMPFYTSKASGMGMGLSISRSIIEAHGGTINFNSKLSFGTTFYFNLPINGEQL